MLPNYGAAAGIPGQSKQLRVKPSGEQAGIASDAAVGHGGDLAWLLRPQRGEGFSTLPLQPWLVGH